MLEKASFTAHIGGNMRIGGGSSTLLEFQAGMFALICLYIAVIRCCKVRQTCGHLHET